MIDKLMQLTYEPWLVSDTRIIPDHIRENGGTQSRELAFQGFRSCAFVSILAFGLLRRPLCVLVAHVFRWYAGEFVFTGINHRRTLRPSTC